MWIPFKRATESVKHTNKTRNKVLRLIYLIKHVKDDALNSTKKAVLKRTVFQEEMTKFFIDCENTMTVCAVKKLKGHTGRTFLGILHTASGAEAAFAAEGNKFHVVASGADIHGTAKRRIATIQHFIDIFHLRISGMEGIFDFLINSQ